jgi:hypothetical protein
MAIATDDLSQLKSPTWGPDPSGPHFFAFLLFANLAISSFETSRFMPYNEPIRAIMKKYA